MQVPDSLRSVQTGKSQHLPVTCVCRIVAHNSPPSERESRHIGFSGEPATCIASESVAILAGVQEEQPMLRSQVMMILHL